MKAVYVDEYGTSEILKYGDRPDPEIAPGEVLIKVGASALNRLDIGLRSGRSYNGALPRIMGCDIAGEVIQISNEAKTQLKIGDKVIIDNRVKCGECENCIQGSDRYLMVRQLYRSSILEKENPFYKQTKSSRVDLLLQYLLMQQIILLC